MNWFAQAPANIALIKYMGKKEEGINSPANTSLSYTLNNLITSVELEKQTTNRDFWEPLVSPGAPKFTLSSKAQVRYLEHLKRIKDHFNYSGGFVVRSCNNFPLGSGLASSASSFAALTKCAVLAICQELGRPLLSIDEQASLSRLGSGSSCRSFYSPWALWTEDTVKAIELPYQDLLHQVILISHAEKEVSSGLAHQRVKTSPLYPGRKERAEENLKLLLVAMENKDWTSAYQICWKEFQDMHHLFETAKEPFSYKTEQTNKVLFTLQKLWEKEGDGPIITMDAGPNVHLLYRSDQAEFAQRYKRDHLVGNFDVL